MADKELAAVKALAAQAGSGPAARQSLIASGAVPKLTKHLSSKTAAITSQSALALNLLASDPTTRSSVWEHQRALVPALVQTLKTGGPLTLARSLTTLAALIKHVSKAGAAVIKANGVIPILRIAQTGSDGPRDAAITALNAFHVMHVGRMPRSADGHTAAALQSAVDLVEPLIRALSDGPVEAKLFALSVLRLLPEEPRVLRALRRPAVTDLLVGFAAGESVEIAATSLEVLAFALGRPKVSDTVLPGNAAYWASPTLCKLREVLPSCLQSPETSLVKAAAQYIVSTPAVDDMQWVQECARNVPLLLQSPSDGVKIQGMDLAIHEGIISEAIPDTELDDGPVLPLIIGLLDPRPRASPCKALPDRRHCYLGTPPDPVASRLAKSTYPAAVAHDGDSPLPPMPVFNSCAEVAETAGRTLASISAQPWGFMALAQRGFYTLAAELLKERILPLGAVATVGRLFSRGEPENPQRLALAMQFLAADYATYLLECIGGGEPKWMEAAVESLGRVAEFALKYADDPEFPTEKVMKALPCAIDGQILLRADVFAALWPSLDAATTVMLVQAGGFETFQNVGGVEWATTMISHGPTHAKVGALTVLSKAVATGQRDGGVGGVPLWSGALGVIVGAALLPPAELVSQEAMTWCILMTDYPPGIEIQKGSYAGSPRVPAAAPHMFPLSEGSGMGGLLDGGHEAGPADLAHGVPAELASICIPAELANKVLAEMARLGAGRAAVAHFKSLSAPPAPGDNSRSRGLNRWSVAKFLCRISRAEGDVKGLQDSGWLQLLVDLMCRGEGDERKEARTIVAGLASSDPAARPTLREMGAIAPLVAHLEDPSCPDTGMTVLAIQQLIADGSGCQPAPGAVHDALAAGAVPVLLRLMASLRVAKPNDALTAFEPLHLIAFEPCGLAAIVAADCAQPLMKALDLLSHIRVVVPSHVATRNMRCDVVRMISKIAEGRPEQGQALFAAGLAAQVATIFSSPLDVEERDLAMQLVEKLSRCGPGACDVLMAAGVFAEIHKVAVAAPDAADLGHAADIPGAAEVDPLANRAPDGVSEAEAAQARALLRRLAGYCGGTLEFAGMDGERIRYTSESGTCQSQCGTPRLETPDGVQARVQPAGKRVCSMCGAVSEKDLRRCSRCMGARYCSQECQKAHWPVHKGECARSVP